VIAPLTEVVPEATTASPAPLVVPSFEQLYTRWFHDVSRWVRAMGGLSADLDDLTQEVFLVVRRKLAQFDGRNAGGWLYSIAKHQVRDYRRRAWVRHLLRVSPREPDAVEPSQLVAHSPDPSEVLQRRQAEQFVNRILAKMSETQRTAFVLFEIEGYSGEEIAALEQIPVNTVWTRLHHARKRFFAMVEEARAVGGLP
jgi:RNA polymerase sigma-70 factor (ECF subfamily)